MQRLPAPLALALILGCSSGTGRPVDGAIEEEPDAAPPDRPRPAPDKPAAPDALPELDARYVSPGQPAGWDEQLKLPVTADLNSDPRLVEITVDARVATVPIDGRAPMSLWTYGGRVPGSLVRARRGDTLVVHFQNHLPEASTIHWHGVRVPVEMDGTPDVQAPVLPGKTFDYRFTLPDAGMYWFHPHAQSAKQVGFGLYAPIIVDDPDEPADLGDEVVLVLSDLAPGANSKPELPNTADRQKEIDGREGSIVLVNGRVKPVLQARPGVRQRWRILNAAKSRYFKLAVPEHRFVQIGSDGGLMQGPLERDDVLLTPGERVDLLVVPTGGAGARLPVQNLPFDRGLGLAPGPEELFYLQLTSDPVAPPPPPVPRQLRAITPLSAEGATEVEINFGHDPGKNEYVTRVDNQLAASNPVHARLGQTQLWHLGNGSTYDHPFHQHGFFFHEVDFEKKPVLPLQWKDTINIGARSQVDVLVRFDDRPGMWMFHCHILDHADVGLMGMVHLAP